MGSSQSKSPHITSSKRSSSLVGMCPGASASASVVHASPRHSATFGRLGNSYSPGASSSRGGSIRRNSSAAGNSNSNSNSISAALVRASSLTGLVGQTVAAAAATVTASEASPLLQSNGGNKESHNRYLVVGEAEDTTASAAAAFAEAGPPLVIWIGPALACALAYALYNIFIKKGSASINPILGGVILQFVAAILGCCLLAGVMYFHNNDDDDDDDEKGQNFMNDNDGGGNDGSMTDDVLFWDWNGIRYAILAGVAVGAAEMISFCVSGMGVQAMQSIPVIIGGSVLFGTVLGWAALGESLSARGWSGVILIATGITLVGLDDDGEGMH